MRIINKKRFLSFTILVTILLCIVTISFHVSNDIAKQIKGNIFLFDSTLINKSSTIQTSTVKNSFIHRKSIVKKNLTVHQKDIWCYNEESDANGLKELEYTKGKESPKMGKSIFFHETSCFGEEGLHLNARQACAVESAAKMHPNRTVYLLYLSPAKVSKSAEHQFKQLLTYKNIIIRRINADKYLKDTPLEKWYSSGILKTSKWPLIHMSDMLRLITLWKYGGIYLDLDVVIRKSLNDLENFAGVETRDVVAVGVIGLGMGNLARQIANACLTDLATNFKGNSWGHQGPLLLTRVLRKVCNASKTPDMTILPAICNGFTVFPASVFYPILHIKFKLYFQTNDMNKTMKIIEKAKAIHVWNKLSHNERISVRNKVPYTIVAQQYCPKVYSNCGDFF